MKDNEFGCLFILLIAILFFTNPDKQEHREEVGSVLEEVLQDDVQSILDRYCSNNHNEFCNSRDENGVVDYLIGRVTSGFLKNHVADFVQDEVGRKNFYIFSLTTVNGNIKGIGILNMVFVSSKEIETDFLDYIL